MSNSNKEVPSGLPSPKTRVQIAGVTADLNGPATQALRTCLSVHLVCFSLDDIRVKRAVGSDRLRPVRLPGGSFSIVAAGTDVQSEPVDPGRYLFVAIDPDYLQATVRDADYEPPLHFAPQLSQIDSEFRQFGGLLTTFLQSPGTYGSLYFESLANVLCEQIARRIVPRPAAEPTLGGTRKRIQRALDFIHANLGDQLTLASMASMASMSPFHFSRCFKKATGLPPHQFVVKCRLEQALRLVESTRLPLNHVAVAAGFGSQSHMTALFRRHLDITPGQLRRRE